MRCETRTRVPGEADGTDSPKPRASAWLAGTAIALAVGLVLVLVLLITGALLDSADDLVTVFLGAVAVAALVGWWQDKLARAERDRGRGR